MPEAQVVFNIDELDDPVLPDGVPSWEGGQFSNWRANLLKPNQSNRLLNCDIDRLGRIRTRKGTTRLGAGPINSGKIIQGLTFFQTANYNYVVAANNRNLYAFNGASWDLIAQGGCVDNDDIVISRSGQINNASGYSIGDRVLIVDGITDIVGTGEKLYFLENLKHDRFEYTIASHAETGGNTTTITLEQPGLVFAVKDNATFIVLRTAKVNNGAGYAAGTTTITIDGYTGIVQNNEYMVILSENVRHQITSHTETGGNTTSITFTTGLLAAYQTNTVNDRVTFAQGVDKLFFSDGTGNIYGWNGSTTMKIASGNVVDFLTGSAYVDNNSKPPQNAKILIWFQNRLIASGISAEPDAIYFSDFLDPTSWDKDFQMIRVGGGDSDPITGLVPWTDLSLIVLKKNSIYVIDCDPSQNPDPADPTLLVSNFAIRKLHSRIGCPAPLTAVQVGGASSTPGSDVFFLDSDKKVRSIRRTLAAENQQELVGDVSQPVQDVLDLVSLTSISNAVAFFHNGHYVLAVPVLGATRPNVVMSYQVHTQSWPGEWIGWTPTAFSLRTDTGDYSKMIFGEDNGQVHQWNDDVALSDEVAATYQDAGNALITIIITRAITFGDPFNFKTGLNAEFEFDESVATVNILAVKDGAVQPEAISGSPFSTLSTPRLKLPQVLPFTLPVLPGLLRKSFDLQRYGTWREFQFFIVALADKLSLRSIRVTGFMDTISLQTTPITEKLSGDMPGA
jgi:hypothetical protein